MHKIVTLKKRCVSNKKKKHSIKYILEIWKQKIEKEKKNLDLSDYRFS